MAGIYIHVPFCKQACIYCNFHFKSGKQNTEPMAKALGLELQLRKEEAKEWAEIQTIYFGGGTPSLLTLQQLSSLLASIYLHYNISASVECTLEANPEDLTLDYCRGLVALGVNRLSIGIQTFDEDGLRWMNRAHTAQTAVLAVQNAQKAGIDNISIDLISGIPQLKEPQQHLIDLRKALDLNPTHLSTYSLTLEPNTVWERLVKLKNYPTPIEAEQAMAFEEIRGLLADNNWVLYEISNAAKSDAYISKHNSAYWERKPYIGIGPSAHSFDGAFRRWNLHNHTHYCEFVGRGEEAPHEKEVISPSTAFNEAIMTGLRRNSGVSLSLLQSLDASAFLELNNQIKQTHLAHHFVKEGDRLKLSEKSLLYADALSAELFSV
jgi:oxygen-independent coproporphyrinogen-3 oxidase